jgi:hypothetical protein
MSDQVFMYITITCTLLYSLFVIKLIVDANIHAGPKFTQIDTLSSVCKGV